MEQLLLLQLLPAVISELVVCQINRVVAEHISHADMTASDVASSWTLIASEGDMKVYKSEVDSGNNFVQHPLKAVHSVKVRFFHICC